MPGPSRRRRARSETPPAPAPAARRAAAQHHQTALLFEPRAATIPVVVVLLVAVLMFEVAMMTYVSAPSARERGLQAAGYTVEYRDCWVLERAAQSLPTLNLSTDLMPVIHKRNLAAGASMAPFEAWKTRWPHAPTTCADWNRHERLKHKLSPPTEGAELRSLVGRLRTAVGSAAQRQGKGAVANPAVLKLLNARSLAQLDLLVGDLAAARGAAFASQSAFLLGRVADPLHDVLWPASVTPSHPAPRHLGLPEPLIHPLLA